MFYIIEQLWIFLLCAFIVGLITGWVTSKKKTVKVG